MSTPIELIRHSRARRLRLAIDPRDGRVRLTLPQRYSQAKALAWAETQRGWIEAARSRLPQAQPFAPGAVLPFGDSTVKIAWRADGPRAPRREGELLHCGGPREILGRRLERWLRAEALALLSSETCEVARRAGVSITRVSVGDPRTRWGSCAANGAIRYSWRLVLMPSHVRRAIVAHEVAHRVHMNHGPAFHALVAQLLGADPKPALRWLRSHGSALHWVGREPADPA